MIAQSQDGAFITGDNVNPHLPARCFTSSRDMRFMHFAM